MPSDHAQAAENVHEGSWQAPEEQHRAGKELKGRRNKGVIAARATCKVEGPGGQAEDDGSNASGGAGE